MISSRLHRRQCVIGAAALLGASSLPRLAAAAEPKAPPRARVAPVEDDYHGTKVTDPYRWMEDPRDPDWLPYLRGQNEATRAALDALPHREALARRVAALSGDTTITAGVHMAGARLFFEQRPAGAQHFKLFVREEGAASRVLIDPGTLDTAGNHFSLDWWQPSFDGEHLVYGLSANGSEESVLHVMVVRTGEVLAERIAMTDDASPSWLPDGSGFFYRQLTGQRGTNTLYQNSVVKLHRLGQPVAQDPVVMRRGLDPAVPLQPLEGPYLRVVPHAKVVLGIVADIRHEFALHIAPLASLQAGQPTWRAVCDFDDLVAGAEVLGEWLYLLVNKGSARGRVVRTPLAAPSLEKAEVVMPQGPMVIEGLYAARDAVFVRLMDGGIHRLARIAAAGAVSTPGLPFEGTIRGIYTSPAVDGAFLSLVGWLQPSAVWRFDAAGTLRDTGINPKPPTDLTPYESRRAFATARDGTRIPYSVLARKNLPRDGRNPTLVDAYGAYQAPQMPRFSPAVLAFLDAGGVLVTAHVRGGGEYGREWHEAGKKATKPNTWRDLIDVCETLLRERMTSAKHLAIMGTSAGGIAVGRAMTERPELFAAVVSNVGWSNPIRYTAEQNIADIGEWGPITDAASFRIMFDMDSYQAIRDGVRYPAVLCITGATDPRVAPWHVTKLAARLQAATASSEPVLLRVDFTAGHGIGSTRAQSDALAADIYAFVLWRTVATGKK